jgi:HSP20 family protein
MYVTTNTKPATALERRISRMFDDAFGNLDWQFRESAAAAWVPPVDVLEEADAIRIMAEVPGVKPDDVKISVEGNVLTIQGTKQQVAEERTERVHRYERAYGQFERTFTLPDIMRDRRPRAGPPFSCYGAGAVPGAEATRSRLSPDRQEEGKNCHTEGDPCNRRW